MEKILQDIRYGIRMLRKSPGFTLVAALTLALGIGANTAIFSLVNGILLSPLPYAAPSELVAVKGTYPKGAFVAMREQVQSMNVATYSEGHEFNLTGMGQPVRLSGALVSAELFSVLGARPEVGRVFAQGEDTAGRDNVVMLSHALWQQRFAGDPSIVGRSIQLEGVPRQVVGVMSASFRFPSPKAEFWVPLHNDPGNVVAYWAGDFMPVIGRLRPGSDIAQADAEIHVFQSHVFGLFPWKMPTSWNADVSVVPLQNGMVSDVRSRLLMLLGAVALVLLIACANVANLTLSRAATREKEMSIRSALGAEKQRIIRQLLTESLLLAAIGGLLGLGLAKAGMALLKATLPPETPRLAEVHLDWRVLLFSAGLTVFTGFIFGIAPALQSSRTAITDALKSGGRGAAVSVSQKLRGALAVAEVGFAVLLIISAGLLIRSFWALSHVDPGFRAEKVLTARITPNETFCAEPGKCLSFYRDLLQQAKNAPGVTGAALVNTLPLNGRVAKRSLELENYVAPPGQTSPLFWLNVVSPDYFKVMGIPMLAGNSFTPADENGNPPSVIVTASTAHRFWGEKNAIGRHVRFIGESEWRTVAGVIADVRAYDLQKNVPDFFNGVAYVPYSPKSTVEGGRVPAEMTIALRTATTNSQLEQTIRGIVAGLSQEVPVSEVKTMETVVSDAVSTPASTTSLFVTFAAVALILGMIGIYGVLSFLVSRRTREIGIRLALGAQRGSVLWLVMKEGAKFSLTGIALGLAGAFALTRLLASELYGISALDPLTFGGVALLMALVTMAACYVPAKRAMAVDPLIALRYD
jgi:putative ABC transport system permease protein